MLTLKYLKYCFIIAFLFLFTSCQPFDFNPYDITRLEKNEENLNAKNIKKISKINMQDIDTFSFALIADTHIEYSILEEAINQINNDKSILFVIHLGDITDGGLYKEFHWTNDKMSKLNIPYVMLTGNHDYLSNGHSIYNQMYGESSFVFSFNKTKFVCFNNVVWENNNTYPDFNWLNNNLSDNKLYDHIFVLSHIPPFSDQFDKYCESVFNKILTTNKVKLSIHGHVHCYSYKQYYNNSSTLYFTADDIKGRNYYKISVTKSTFNIQQVPF